MFTTHFDQMTSQWCKYNYFPPNAPRALRRALRAKEKNIRAEIVNIAYDNDHETLASSQKVAIKLLN